MISKLWKQHRRWKCRRDFNRLSEEWQFAVELAGIDPESLIRRGEL